MRLTRRQVLQAGAAAAAALTLRSAVAALPPAPVPPRGLGVGIAWQRGTAWATQSRELLQPPVWANWVYDAVGQDGYMPMVFTLRDDGWARQAMTVAREHPGHLWLLGNEPDTDAYATAPADAAALTQAWAAEVGGLWACCGVQVYDPALRPEANWLTWLDGYLAAGGAIGTHWHIHIYGASVLTWQDELARFRAWSAARGVERPVVVSETAAWYGDGAYNARLLDVIAAQLASDPALTAVLWYSDADYWQRWPSTDLRDADGLTALGAHYVGVTGAGNAAWRLWLPGMRGR